MASKKPKVEVTAEETVSEQTKVVVFILSEDTVAKLADSLSKLPYAEVAQLFAQLQSQAANQGEVVKTVSELNQVKAED